MMRKKILLMIVSLSLLSCGNIEMKTPANAMNKFENFKKKEKFVSDTSIFYPGIGDENLKPILTEKINLAADDFKKAASLDNVTDENYQNAIKTGLNRFSEIYLDLDTENRERICMYFEELMDIVGLESSNGQLNDFMYDFNPDNN